MRLRAKNVDWKHEKQIGNKKGHWKQSIEIGNIGPYEP